ncbi:mandelate racemase/muconate lactonizing enzyme family protein [Pseudooceanicola sp. LIPI14-2-Ac024]|uniref:mandelate racemase/muconate lactonizing enzyme family protein n=1 Tax=Pseudooceanicola sp. LIPI14-2-Ac024 TaxID=3344875 RepID=UPI0035D0343C
MKIRSARPRRVGQFLFVEIITDNDIRGFGESGAWGHLEASEAALQKYCDYLIGQDPRRIERHWQIMHRFAHFNGAAVGGAISAVDIALWDIKAKSYNAPLYDVLGGAVRDKLRVYAHVYAKTVDEVADFAREKAQEGFTALGHLNPFLDEPEDQPYFLGQSGLVEMGMETVRRCREAAGPNVDLMLELHRRLTPAEAIAFAREAAEYRPGWLEDPIRPENIDAMAEVAAKSPVPIATGERYFNIYQFKMAIERRALSFARVSVGVCGGITGALKVAAIAEANDVKVAPHNPISPIGVAACSAIGFARDNVHIQEYPTGYDNMVLESTPELLGQAVVDGRFTIEHGFMQRIDDRKGLGIELRDDAEEIRPPITRAVSMRRHLDGGVVDQ